MNMIAEPDDIDQLKAIHAAVMARWRRSNPTAPPAIDYEQRARDILNVMTDQGVTLQDVIERLNYPSEYVGNTIRKHIKLGLVRKWRAGNSYFYGLAA